MKVVLDTNVLVSGIFFSGPPQFILEAWGEGRFELILSPEILAEYQEVVERLCAKFPGAAASHLLAVIVTEGTLLPSTSIQEPVCDDPGDDKFLAAALSAKVRIIVSGERHLLDVADFRRIRVLRPREFVDEFLS